jgi:hypothetical protein
MTAAPGGLARVLDSFRAGTSSTDDIARDTGLDRELVALALDQLTTLGLVTRSSMSAGCDGCDGCPALAADGCRRPASRGGLVTLALGRRPC